MDGYRVNTFLQYSYAPHLGHFNLRLVMVWGPIIYALILGTNRALHLGHSNAPASLSSMQAIAIPKISTIIPMTVNPILVPLFSSDIPDTINNGVAAIITSTATTADKIIFFLTLLRFFY